MAHGIFGNNPGDFFNVPYRPCVILFSRDVQQLWADNNAHPTLEECQVYADELRHMTAVQILQPRHAINQVVKSVSVLSILFDGILQELPVMLYV
jgi:hypothetical protein